MQVGSDANCLLQGLLENEHTGYSGAGYANPDNRVGAGLIWHVRTDQPGEYALTLRYANGSASARPGTLSINQANAVDVSFAPTSAWTTWRDLQLQVALAYGSNLISLFSTGSDGLANIDSLSLSGTSLALGNCAAAQIDSPAAVAVSENVPFTAEPFTAGADKIRAYDWQFGDGGAGQGQSVSHRFNQAGNYTVVLTVTDNSGEQSETRTAITVNESAGPIKVFIAGDSTVSTYTDTASPNDQAGWGQMLPQQYNNQVTIDNRAVGGRTSRRFIDEGRLDAIWNDIKAGDYLLVQFGTNDGHKTATYDINGQTIPYYLDPNTDFKTWLKRYVDGARSRQVQLVFVTPPPRNSAYCTGGNGTGAHAQAMRELAAAEGVPLVDLNQKSVDYLKSICPSPTPENFFLLRADGSVDGTHFQEHGARVLAGMVADGMAEAGLPIAQHQK